MVLPYVKGTSEDLARIFKRYDIETIHKPSTTLKNLLCNKMKDKVHDLDKTGAVYYNDCIKHKRNDYVGETERVTRERLYEHRIIDHKTSKRSASLGTIEEEEIPKVADKNVIRRSSRIRAKKDYKAMHEGSNQILNEGSTEFSAHVAGDTHEKGDLRYTILCTEDNWFKRGVKEAIAIKKIRPTLNKDEGRYHLSPIYDQFIRSSVVMKTPDQGAKDGSEGQHF